MIRPLAPHAPLGCGAGRWRGRARCLRAGILAALVGAVAAHVQPQAWAQAATLRVGLNQDIDTLDPTLSQSYASRVVLTQLCERLYDLDANAVPVPQLAASLPESTDHGRTQVIRLRSDLRFSDGTAFDAHAVKLSLERHLTLRGSMRRTELGTLAAVEVVAPLTVRLRLDRPFAPLLMALADRAGMILSPAQLSRLGERFGTDPVCVGPWRFAEAVPGQRIVLERSPFYGSGSRSNIERIEFRPIPDSARRLAALHSGEVDVINAVPPLDIASLRGSPGFGVIQVLGPGYVGITINIANRSGRQAGASNLGTPWSQQPKVREALELSLDRAGLNRIALGGEYVPGCTPFSPAMPFHPKELKCALRDVLRAKRLLAEEGFPGGLSLGLTVVDDPVQLRVGQAIQAMARDAGIRVRLKPAPFREILDLQEWGRFEALLLGFAGRLDPDSVIYPFHTCRGTFNFSLSCDPALDLLLTEAQEQESTQAREKLYGEAVERLSQTRSIIYLYHQKYTLAYSRRIKGLVPSPDGLVRLAGVRLESVPTSTGVRSPSGRRGARRLSNL